MITVTPEAANRINEVVASHGGEFVGLRFGLRDGGCSGYAYLLEFEGEADEDDVVFEQDGARVFIHPLHIPYLQGSVLTWRQGDFETGFAIDNPNVKRMCGCGESFDVG